ncbi:hypothetical protein SRB5_58290 [Streptomyces sp. RB5]|uniref:Uncharacterized protein n=1 Tax=Streptomyces smaragdinus TaxID=2585196 RepID=A0A7K0CRM2_9ACTN|nr:hypothetical protein [Streptomyces smaragdinus]MQY15642.1 hypothetical protein [Streptomyces smaragdinus]
MRQGDAQERLVRSPASVRAAGTAPRCPECGSTNVAQVLGDNGGVTYVCTACGHSWN